MWFTDCPQQCHQHIDQNRSKIEGASVLLETMPDVHRTEATCNVKNMATCQEIFTAVCCHYFERKFVATVCKNVSTLTTVLDCLL